MMRYCVIGSFLKVALQQKLLPEAWFAAPIASEAVRVRTAGSGPHEGWMGLQVALNHRTEYRYDKAVSLGPQVIQLRPAPHCRTPILSYSLKITPAQHLLNWQLDPHHNYLARVLFSNKTNEFVVEVDLVAELSSFNPFAFLLEPGVQDYPFEYEPTLAKDLEPYRSVDPAGPSLRAFLGTISDEKRGMTGFLVDLNRRVRDQVGYETRMNPGVQGCEETLERRMGSCRDSAWLLVQILRHLGFAARFVSGYLIQLASEDDGPNGTGAPKSDSADLHARQECFRPGVQICRVRFRSAGAVGPIILRSQLNEVPGDKARRESQMPENLHEEPRGIAARTHAPFESLFASLNARIHPGFISNLVPHPSIQVDQEAGHSALFVGNRPKESPQ